ncbi:MAG TPA: cytochrome c oxidase subunit 4 [Anaerolineales bacterium]|nr:cytochrome c oxidase subunit 4 [Anaerolineales bacterium]
MMSPQAPAGIHLPSPSFWPIVLAASVLLVAAGILSTWIVSLVGVVGLIASIVGWVLENRQAGEAAHG